MFVGCVRRGPWRTSEVGGVWRCCRAPLSRQVLVTAPVWEAFPEVNRDLAGRLLGLVVERMVQAMAGGGERGELVPTYKVALYCVRHPRTLNSKTSPLSSGRCR
jgi:hypothetical protein